MIGHTIEHYRILQHLGDGGMGTVFRALDTMLEREVALKVLRTDLSDQSDVAPRFRAEAVTLARLSHPNIATLYGLARYGSQLCMVMELVPGETLAALMQRQRTLTWERAARLTVQILAALDYAHAAGIVHRDIKPSNVIVSSTGVVKVLDFGIARVLDTDRLTRQGLVVGTPQYMAPEQIRAEALDGRADVYSVGVILYELLAGRLPVRGENEIAVLYAHLEGRITPLSDVAPATPSWLCEVVERALTRTPAGRFPTAGAFRDVLEDRLPHRPSGSHLAAGRAADSSDALTVIGPNSSPSMEMTALSWPPRTPTPPTPPLVNTVGGRLPSTPSMPAPSLSGSSISASAMSGSAMTGSTGDAATTRGSGIAASIARLRTWMLPRVTWEYQAGPDGMLTVRRAVRTQSGMPAPAPAAVSGAQPFVGELMDGPAVRAGEAGSAKARGTGRLVAVLLAIAAVAGGASFWLVRPDPPPNRPPSGSSLAAAAPSGAAPAAGQASPPGVTTNAAPATPGAMVTGETPVAPTPDRRVYLPSGATTPAPSGSLPAPVERPGGPSPTGPADSAGAVPTPVAVVAPAAVATPAVADRFVPPASLRDEVFEELVLLVPEKGNEYHEVEVRVTFERDRLVIFDTDEERNVATIAYHRGDGPSMTALPTWLTGKHDWLIVPTTTGRIVVQLDYFTAKRAAAAFEARTGRATPHVRGELDR